MDCQHGAGCYGDAMATLHLVVSSLPSCLLVEGGVMEEVVREWVRGWREVVQYGTETGKEWRDR